MLPKGRNAKTAKQDLLEALAQRPSTNLFLASLASLAFQTLSDFFRKSAKELV